MIHRTGTTLDDRQLVQQHRGARCDRCGERKATHLVLNGEAMGSGWVPLCEVCRGALGDVAVRTVDLNPGGSYILKVRHVDGTYRSLYRRGVKYSPWKTVAKYPTMEEAIAAAREQPHVGLRGYAIFHQLRLVWQD